MRIEIYITLAVILIVAIVILIFLIVRRSNTTEQVETEEEIVCVNPPTIPQNLQIVSVIGDIVSLQWTAVEGSNGYRVYAATFPTFTRQTAEILQASSGPSTTVGNLQTGVNYYFKVSAVNQCGESALSPPQGFTIPFQFPSRFDIINSVDTSLKMFASGSVNHPRDVIVSTGEHVTSKFRFDNGLIKPDLNQTQCLMRDNDGTIRFYDCNMNLPKNWEYNQLTENICIQSTPNQCMVVLATSQDNNPDPNIPEPGDVVILSQPTGDIKSRWKIVFG